MKRIRYAIAGVVFALALAALWFARPYGKRSRESTVDAGAGRASAASLDPTHATAALEGIALGADGKPVAGARVTVFVADRDAPAIPEGTSTAGADGHFRVGNLLAGLYGVTATAPGKPGAFAPNVSLEDHETRKGITLRFGASGFTLRGKVSATGGQAVPGAIVRARSGSQDAGDVFESVADERGEYALSLASGRYDLIAAAPGHALRASPVEAFETRSVDFVLEPAVRIRGRVVARSGRAAVAGALASVTSQWWWASQRVDVRTDAKGEFTVEGLGAGEYRVSAQKGPLSGKLRRAITISRPDEKQDVVVEVSPQRTVSGLVHGPAGKPLPGTRVTLQSEARGEFRRRLETDQEGRFRFEGIFPGKYEVETSAPGFASAGEKVDVAESDPEDLEIALDEGASLAGRVVGANGNPIEGVTVAAAGLHERTRDDGSFRFQSLPVGDVALVARDESGRASAKVHLAAGEKGHADLKLEPAGSISGTVRWESGEPAGGAAVEAVPENLDNEGAVARTAADGTWRVPALATGSYHVIASLDPGSNAFLLGSGPSQKDVDLAEQEQKSAVDLSLHRGDRAIEGMVVDAGGAPISDSVVRIAWEGPERRPPVLTTATSGLDGHFRIGGLDAGKYVLTVTHSGFSPARSAAVDSGARDVRIPLAPESRLAGSFVDENGKPIADYDVALYETPQAESAGVESTAAITVHDPDGVFEFGGLADGTYTVIARNHDGRVGRVSGILIRPGANATRVVARTGGTIRGRVVSFPDEKPLEGVAIDADVPAAPLVKTDADGRFTIFAVPPEWAVRLAALSFDMETIHSDSFVLTFPKEGATNDVGTLRLAHGAFGEFPDADPGIGVQWKDGVTTVEKIRPGSAAAASGVSVGDRIVSVNGTTVEGLGPWGVLKLLGGKSGTKVKVSFRNGAGERNLVLGRQPAS